MFMAKSIIKQNVGIDIAKDDFKACLSVMDAGGRISICGSRTFSNTHKGFQEFAVWVERKRERSVTVHLTMEATGVYYEGLAYFLWNGQGYAVQVILPNKVKNYAKSLDFKSKTDKIDAQILARFGLERELRHWQPVSSNLLELKQITRERDRLVRNRTAMSNQLHSSEHEGKPNRRIIDRTGDHIALLDRQIKEIEGEIKTLVGSDDNLKRKFAFLQSIPGVGLLTCAVVVAETNGFETFTGIKQLTSYAGLDVKIQESGAWKGKSRISKRGNSRIRKALFMPSLSRVKHDRAAALFCERIRQRKGKPMVALVAVQRKTLGLMFSLWKNEVMYSGTDR
jgi:transposase